MNNKIINIKKSSLREASRVLKKGGIIIFPTPTVYAYLVDATNTAAVEKLYSPVESLAIIGGGAKSDVWCQIYANILNRRIRRVANPQEAGALGAAIIAKMALGEIKSLEEIQNYTHYDKEFVPQSEYRNLYDNLFEKYKQLYKQNKKWFKQMND